MQEQLQAIEALTAERTSLRLLVSELLLENQNLRMKIAKAVGGSGVAHPAKDANAPATHPQPHPGH
jgi:hypothetical protein